MKTLPVAVQVYSVRDDAEKDFRGTMQKIKALGYEGVELAGLYGLEPAEIKAAIADAGLVALSAHVPFQELVADMDGTIAKYVEIGVQYIAIPYLMEEDRPGTPKFEDNVKPVSYTHLDVYKRQVLQEYLALKEEKRKARETGAYTPEKRREIAWRYGKLLSYTDEGIERLLAANRDRED